MPRAMCLSFLPSFLPSFSPLRANGASDPNPTTIGQSPRGRHAHSRLPHGARAGEARSLQRWCDSPLSVGEIGRSVYLPLPACSPPVGPRSAPLSLSLSLSLPLTSAARSQDGGCDERVRSRKHRRRRYRAEWSAEGRAAWPSWMTISLFVVARQSATAHHSAAAAAAAAAAGAADGHPPLQIGRESSWARTKVRSN